MHSVPPASPAPTNLAPLPRLLAYTQGLGLEWHLSRAKRGIQTLALALVWLVLTWRGTGRPHRLRLVDEPLLAALLGRPRLPCAQSLHRSLGRFAAHDVRAAVEAASLAELPRRAGRIWAAVDGHQVRYWGPGRRARFEKGWSTTQPGTRSSANDAHRSRPRHVSGCMSAGGHCRTDPLRRVAEA